VWLQINDASSELILKEGMLEAIKHSVILRLAESTHAFLEVISVQAPFHGINLEGDLLIAYSTGLKAATKSLLNP